MNKTNWTIIFTILSFILIYQFVLYFGIKDISNTSAIIVSQKPNSSVDTLSYNDAYKLTILKDDNQKMIQSELLFNQNPNFLLYIFFLTFFASTSLSLIFPLIVRTKKKLGMLLKKEVIGYAILSLLITIGIFGICNYIPFAWHPQEIMEHLGILLKHPVPTLMALLSPLLILATICIFGIFGVSSAITKKDFSAENKKESIQSFCRYKKLLNEYILIFGLFIASGSIILSSLLADTINNYVINNSSIQLVPNEFVYLYGLAFTGAILIIYVPVYLKIREIGSSFVSTINPIDYDNLEDWNKNNDTYLNTLGIAGSAWDGVKTSLKILSPIITSILATIIKTI